MEQTITAFFRQYQQHFQQGLQGTADMAAVAASYAPAFIAASPAGVSTGHNDVQLPQVMEQGFARYRQLGTRDMLLREVHVVPIDALHCLAHVGWTASYARDGQGDIRIDFEVHYLMQLLDGKPKIFGWVAEDEEALLREHGVV